MFPLVDLAVTLGGLIIPPAFNFIKKKFIKSENDTPERTIGDLATTKPEVLPDYTNALATLKDAEVKFFNRDVIGTASQWVVDLRASIRPIGVVFAFILLVLISLDMIDNADGIRLSSELVISSWFGDRITLK